MPFLLPSQRCSITKRGAVSICSASHKTVLLSFRRYFLVTVHQSWHFKNFFTSSVTHISACNWSKIYLLILFAFSPVSHEVYVVSCVKTRIAAYVLQLMSFNKYVTRIHFWFWVAILLSTITCSLLARCCCLIASGVSLSPFYRLFFRWTWISR